MPFTHSRSLEAYPPFRLVAAATGGGGWRAVKIDCFGYSAIQRGVASSTSPSRGTKTPEDQELRGHCGGKS